MQNGVLKIGIDVGYGDVKTVASYNGQIEYFKFPTAVAYAGDGFALGGFKAETEVSEYKYNGRTYKVGKPALSCPELFSTRDISFLLTYAPLLVYVALEQLAKKYSMSFEDLAEAEKHLCVGLPLAHWEKHKVKFTDILTSFQVSGRHIRFDTIEVLPQGQGVLVDYVLDDSGNENEDRGNSNLLIVDIGFNTVDILCVEEGICSKRWSDMIEGGGICRICDILNKHLQKSEVFLPEQAVKDVLLKKELSIYGQKNDYSTVIRNASEAYTDMLEQEIRSRWAPFLQKAHKLILAGGGAYYVGNFSGYSPGFAYTPYLSEYCNARGFIKYLVARCQLPTTEVEGVRDEGLS